jgi:hypothetical protein
MKTYKAAEVTEPGWYRWTDVDTVTMLYVYRRLHTGDLLWARGCDGSVREVTALSGEFTGPLDLERIDTPTVRDGLFAYMRGCQATPGLENPYGEKTPLGIMWEHGRAFSRLVDEVAVLTKT